ncbi:MAG: pyridoxal-phosphate dependent enzyme, partial [Oceanospirillaceae bacterium]
RRPYKANVGSSNLSTPTTYNYLHYFIYCQIQQFNWIICMDFRQSINLKCQILDCDLYRKKQLTVHLIRSDQAHLNVSGNKWFKLKYALLAAKQQQIKTVVSFGGAYSNHIHALAYAGQALQIPVVGYIRGEWTVDNPTLKDAQAWGMQLKSLTREEYREKSSAEFLQKVALEFPQSMVIPEGGTNQLALQGVNELMTMIEQQLPALDHLVAACGTGGTLAGLISGARSTRSILGIPVLKGAGFLQQDIQALLWEYALENTSDLLNKEYGDWQLDLEGHYGGYGKVKQQHLAAMLALESEHKVALEPIYTAKMWRRFDELVAQDYFKPGSQIALLHSGGLQGRRSFAV